MRLSERSRKIFVSTNSKTCTEVRLANVATHAIPIEKGGDFTPAQIEKFCSCTADRNADSFTEDEWSYLSVHQNDLPSAKAKGTAILQQCLAEIHR